MKHIVSRMSSYFPNRWPLSYLNLTKNMKTYIRRQQHKKFFKHQDIKRKEPPQKYRLGTISNTKLLAVFGNCFSLRRKKEQNNPHAFEKGWKSAVIKYCLTYYSKSSPEPSGSQSEHTVYLCSRTPDLCNLEDSPAYSQLHVYLHLHISVSDWHTKSYCSCFKQ